MLIVDMNAQKVIVDLKGKRPTEPARGTVYLETKEDVEALAGKELLDAFNAIAVGAPDFGIVPVSRFSAREAGVRRLLGLVVRLTSAQSAGEETPAKEIHQTAERRTRSRKIAKEQAPRIGGDLELQPAKKVYDARAGTKQAFMLGLLLRKGGIVEQDFIDAMNAEKTSDGKKRWAEYDHGRAWGSIVFNLHNIKGWGVARRSVSGKAARAQDYLCKQSERYRFFADEISESVSGQPRPCFAWIHGAQV